MRQTLEQESGIQRSPKTGAVSLRDMTWEDLDQVADEFERTWSQADSDGESLSRLESRHFVLRYLLTTSRARVACLDGRFMGVTLLGLAGQPILFPQAPAQLTQADAALSASDQGARTLERMQAWHRLEERVEDSIEVRSSAQAELKLFLVAAQARGHGVGGLLWRDMLAYLGQAGVKRFFLHTDSSCDVSYYDHIGMERAAARWSADHPEETDERSGFYEDIFVYAASVADQQARWGLRNQGGGGSK
ncbi:hypothetical protein AB656_00475 [Bifidobacterium actinocoloniiforme DSM 22766]|nr:hypothetical protein AB656_00475 [Bifidobacterium actinocoloniiforme DSM 22766]